MTGVDDPEPGDAVEVVLAVDVVEGAALAAVEDVHAVALGQLDPRRVVDPDVIERFLRSRYGGRGWIGDGGIGPARFDFGCHVVCSP